MTTTVTGGIDTFFFEGYKSYKVLGYESEPKF